MTIKELARIAGYNHSTVSRALNNSPLISEETKERVRELAAEYNFELNASARGMRTKKTGTIGVIFPSFQDRYRDMQYLGGLMNSLRYTIEAEQYDSIITFPKNPGTGKSNISRLIRQKKVDGLILVIQEIDEDDWNILNESGIPFVSLHFKWDSPHQAQRDYVYPDNYRGGVLAANCLLDAGCKSIICLTAEDRFTEFEDRTRGCLDAVGSSGSGAAVSVFSLQCGFEQGYNFVMENRELISGADGIFAQADMVAIGAIEAMKELGIRVPEDVSVVGYDDIDIDYFFRPGLTTIHQPKERYSEMACRRLVEMIDGSGTERMQSVIEPELLVRDSCKCRGNAI